MAEHGSAYFHSQDVGGRDKRTLSSETVLRYCVVRCYLDTMKMKVQNGWNSTVIQDQVSFIPEYRVGTTHAKQ